MLCYLVHCRVLTNTFHKTRCTSALSCGTDYVLISFSRCWIILRARFDFISIGSATRLFEHFSHYFWDNLCISVESLESSLRYVRLRFPGFLFCSFRIFSELLSNYRSGSLWLFLSFLEIVKDFFRGLIDFFWKVIRISSSRFLQTFLGVCFRQFPCRHMFFRKLVLKIARETVQKAGENLFRNPDKFRQTV